MFSNLKIIHKMIIGTILMVLIIVSVGYFGFNINNRIDTQSRIVEASRSMAINITEGQELLSRYLSADNLDKMGMIEKEMVSKSDIVNAWIKILTNNKITKSEAIPIEKDLEVFGVTNQENILSDPALEKIAKSIELSKNQLNDIYLDLIKVHEDKIKLLNDFDLLYQKEKEQRYIIKNTINESSDLELTRIIGDVLYFSKEALYQYRDQEHIDQWLLSINNLKNESELHGDEILINLINEYYLIANQMGGLVLEIEETEKNELIKKAAYDDGIGKLNIDKDKMNNIILSLSTQNIKNTNIFLFGIVFLAIIIGIIISAIITHSITEPIKKLVVTAKKIADGDLASRVDVRGNDEISQFAEIFNKMVVKLQKANKEIVIKLKNQAGELAQSQESLRNQQKALVNVLEDVEQERREASEERDRINTILKGIADGVIVIDRDMNIILFNKKAEELSGLSINEVLNKNYVNLLNFVYEDNLLLKNDFIEKAIKDGESLALTTQASLVRKDKAAIPINKSVSIIKNDEGQVVACVVVFRDVTKEREIDKAKTEFVSLASHQLRTPLSSISWYTEMLLAGDAGKINKEQKEYLTEVYAGSRRMVDLVNSLLNVSRIELGTFAIDPKPMEVKSVCDAIIKELIQDITKKNIKIIKNISKDTPTIIADPKLISIIFQNLLSNSVKYTLPGGNIKINIEKDNQDIAIEIADSGMGIPANQQGQIFSKMFRADNVRMTDTEGTGLGLYIVKAIVQNSGGSISFKSKEGKGTAFYIKLPIKGVEKRVGTKELSAG